MNNTRFHYSAFAIETHISVLLIMSPILMFMMACEMYFFYLNAAYYERYRSFHMKASIIFFLQICFSVSRNFVKCGV